MKPLISIIVPVYNLETYLFKCIDSLCRQSYRNIEIILVNDGSTDSSGVICDEFAKKDNRIKVIHKSNGGVSEALNFGLNEVCGEYLGFVSGDDYISLEMYEILYEKLCESDLDISMCKYVPVYENGTEEKIIKYGNDYQLTNLEAIECLLSSQGLMSYGWPICNKLYKTSLFIENEIRFTVGRKYEDCSIMHKLYFYSNGIYIVDRTLYYYLQRTDSSSHKKFSEANLEIFTIIKEIRSFLNEKKIECDQALNRYIIYSNLQLILILMRDKVKNKEFYKIFKNNIFEAHPYSNKFLSKKTKISLLFLKMGYHPFKIIWCVKLGMLYLIKRKRTL